MYRNSAFFAAPGAPAAPEHEVSQRFSDGEDPVRVCPVPEVSGGVFEGVKKGISGAVTLLVVPGPG